MTRRKMSASRVIIEILFVKYAYSKISKVQLAGYSNKNYDPEEKPFSFS